MRQYPCHVLLIEDNPGDAILVRESLEIIDPFEFEMSIGASLADGMSLLRQKTFDIILLDLSLPDSQGLDTLKAVQATAERTPIIVLTGLSDDQTTTAAMAKGAQDYLVKDPGNYGVLYHSIRYSIERNGLTQKINGYPVAQRSEAALSPLRLRGTGPGQWQRDFLEFSQSILETESLLGSAQNPPGKSTPQGKLARPNKLIDCNEVIEKILCHFRREIHQAGIEVFSHALPLIQGDPFEITQLFQTLISEAIHYASHRSDPLAMSAIDQGSHWFFSLVQGANMPESTHSPASGLAPLPGEGNLDLRCTWPGSPLCQQIVEAHGGTLGHRLLPEGGNQFWFTLAKSPQADR